MNKQEVFNRVYKHMLTQKARSLHSPHDTACAYRGRGGTMCAVGCLIDDDHFSDAWNTSAVDDPDVLSALGASLGSSVLPADLPLLMDLQQIHDIADPLDWLPALNALARIHELEIPNAP